MGVRAERATTRAQNVLDARALRAQGLADVEIAARLGLSRRQVQRYRTDPDGSRERGYKRVQRASKRKAGRPSRTSQLGITYERVERLLRDGLSVLETATVLGCTEANIRSRLKSRGTTYAELQALGPIPRQYKLRWSEDEITSAMIHWKRLHGRPPTWEDWRKTGADHPTSTVVSYKLGGWRNALARVFGSPPPETLWAEIDRQLRETDRTVMGIARACGVHHTTIYTHYRNQGTTVGAVRAEARRRALQRWGLLDYFVSRP